MKTFVCLFVLIGCFIAQNVVNADEHTCVSGEHKGHCQAADTCGDKELHYSDECGHKEACCVYSCIPNKEDPCMDDYNRPGVCMKSDNCADNEYATHGTCHRPFICCVPHCPRDVKGRGNSCYDGLGVCADTCGKRTENVGRDLCKNRHKCCVPKPFIAVTSSTI